MPAGSNSRTPRVQQQRWAIWLCCLCLSLQLQQPHHQAAAAPPPYEPRLWNLSCNYTVSGIPAAAFFNRSDAEDGAMFPVSPGYRMAVPDGYRGSVAQLSCFGPGQRVNQTLIAAGLKMPCGYAVRPDGLVDFWEEGVCDMVLRSNCYCYSLNVQHNRGYCIPGYASTGSTDVDFNGVGQETCADAARKVQLDGGRPVTRKQVYAAQPPEVGHYIALIIWPNSDFHFLRRDEDDFWSQKRGDTFVTNSYPNGSRVADVEDPAILGAYSVFCGYFYVDPATHANTDSDSTWTYSSVPKRLEQAQRMGYSVDSTPLAHPSTGWMRLNYPYLLFGLDAAVFESGERRLPWQASAATVTEAGSRQGAAAGAAAAKASSGSALKPHWVSHVQRTTTVQERDRAVRAAYKAIVADRGLTAS